MARRVRMCFVSYARDDAALVDRFVALMRPRCATLREAELRLWTDRSIAAGERWRQEVVTALTDADLGLVCVAEPARQLVHHDS